jgi:hypothetical protein
MRNRGSRGCIFGKEWNMVITSSASSGSSRVSTQTQFYDKNNLWWLPEQPQVVRRNSGCCLPGDEVAHTSYQRLHACLFG